MFSLEMLEHGLVLKAALVAEHARQREARGDYLDYGTPDWWLLQAADWINDILAMAPEIAALQAAPPAEAMGRNKEGEG